ncbi:hypothetical protein PFTANZ_06435, partial [Plasmodium falciparum Tanzania (2000708)]
MDPPVRSPRATGTQSAPNNEDPKDAKELLDRIGQDVYKKVKGDSEQYREKLEGKLTEAVTTTWETVDTINPCKLVEDYYNNHVNGNSERYPCGTGKEERFSDTLGGQCTDQQIEGNDRNNGGACAPYRRLYLCNKNMVKMDTNNNDGKAKHNLLLEVCMAAKYEGDLIKDHYTNHERTNEGTASELCTVLARSFADIGDIVRGKDLFYGNTQERAQRKKLDDSLKEIFKKIHEDVTKKNAALQTRYGQDGQNFYQLREDWWTANRATVWKAITCDNRLAGAHYFRKTCNGGEQTTGYCRCNDDKPDADKQNIDPPTYFDYVPQYLRWFEEWAEDFCRKKNKKIKDVKRNCRDETEKYCSGNGYDCTKTIYKKGKLVISSECTKCSVWCRLYESWIDNQKKEFLKQRKKCRNEIPSSKRKKRIIRSGEYEGYEKKFYEQLKKHGYDDVTKFLGLLNKEATCEAIGDEKEKINFKTVDNRFNKNKNDEGTFYHSEYCKVCPGCGVERKGDKWTEKKNGTCDVKKPYKILNDKNFNGIDVLSFGDKGNEIKSKIDKFCLTQNGKSGKDSSIGSGDCGGNSDPSLCEPWQCYKHNEVQKDDDDDEHPDYVKNAGGLCILPNPKKKKEESDSKSQNEPEQFQKTFNDFFYFWIRRFLNDSMYWREKVNSCINNSNPKKCVKKCYGKCECFLKWIGKKEKEWEKIKVHFDTQEGFDILGNNYDLALKILLNIDELFKDIKDGYGNAKELEGIKKLLDEEKKREKEAAGVAGGVVGVVVGDKDNTTIDKLLKHEAQDAEQCKDCKEPTTKPGDLARSADSDDTPSRPDHAEEQEEEDDIDDSEDDFKDDENEDEVEEEDKETDPPEADPAVVENTEEVKEVKEEKGPSQEDPKVCETVDNILTKDTTALNEACKQKYQYGKEKFPNWKCVTPSGKPGDNTATREGAGRVARHTTGASDTTRDSDTTGGSICVPPRRRRLYVGKLHDWAKTSGSNTVVSGQAQTQGDGQNTPVSGGNTQESESPQGLSTSATASRAQSDPLLTAFVESAAVETFFAWHRYKAENTKTQGGAGLGVSPDQEASQEVDPEDELKNGTIPEEFKRQMFYTLADYKDILDGKNMEVVNLLKDGSPSDKEMYTREKKIKDAIDKVFSNSVSKPSGPPKTDSDKNPKTWWNKHAESIWNGMVCALTYKENGSGGADAKIERYDEVRSKLWDDAKKKPKDPQYEYETVELKEEVNGAKPETKAPASSDNTPKTTLKNFVLRPPYFRYLEEWGETFCRERRRRLAQIKHECRSEKTGKEHCSGDGHDCTDRKLKHKNMFDDLDCPDCYKQCRKYRKWIDMKFAEFHKQKDKYKGERGKLPNNSNGGGDKNCCKDIENHKSAADFLKELKHCKNAEGDEEKDEDKKNKLDFTNITQTFSRSTYCKTCPPNEVTCNRGRRRTNPCTPDNGNKWQSVFDKIPENNGKSSTIEVEMIDRRWPFIKEYLKNSEKLPKSGNSVDSLFKESRLFKSVRKQEWECRFNKEEKTDVCNLTNYVENIDLNQYTTFKVFLLYWLEDFLYGYYISKKRKIVEKCTPKEGETCSEGNSKNYCVCVKKWVEQKKEEWEKIKKYYDDNFKVEGEPIYSRIRSFFNQQLFDSAIKKDKGNVTQLSDLEKSVGCNCAENSKELEDANKKDIVECIHENLDTKIKPCFNSTSGEKQAECEKYTPPEPDDDLLLEEENTVEAPNICPNQVEETKKVVEEDACKRAEVPSKESSTEENSGDSKNEDTPALNPEPPAPAPEQNDKKELPKEEKKVEPPIKLLEKPHVLTALVTSTLAWSVGIGFATFTYFYLK